MFYLHIKSVESLNSAIKNTHTLPFLKLNTENITPNLNDSASILDMVLGGSLIVQLVLLVLIVLSFWSWSITISKYFLLRKARRDTEEFNRIFAETRDLSRIDDSSRRLNSSPVVGVFVAGYKEFIRLLQERSNLNSTSSYKLTKESYLDALKATLVKAEAAESERLEEGMIFLATTASSAPFIGLFGTVWGIMNAFRGLSSQKANTIQAVAPGISEALIATAVGLAAAIPAAIAYNYVAGTVKKYRRSMRSFSDQFEAIAKRNLPE
jgi:biopolymer transport protein TolQ